MWGHNVNRKLGNLIELIIATLLGLHIMARDALAGHCFCFQAIATAAGT